MSAEGPNRTRDALSASKRRLIEERLHGSRKALQTAAQPLPVRADGGRRLASPSEQWIFLAHQSSATPESLNITSSFRVAGALDVPRLERAVNRVIARHEILRSSFRLATSQIEVVTDAEATITIQSVRCQSEDDIVPAAEDLARAPFTLDCAPLLRVHYLEADGAPALLTLVVHDIIFDKWSLGIFWNETAAFYAESRHGERVRLTEPRLQYGEVAGWQREWLKSADYERQLDYWRTNLAELGPPLSMPTDRPYPSHVTHDGRLERWHVAPEAAERLKRLAAGESATLFMLLLAAFDILLHRYTGATDIVVGSPVANRRRKETAGSIGFFLSTVALRARLGGDPTARDVLRQVRDTVLQALEHQDVPFDRVVEAVRPPRITGRHPVFQVMFVYQRENEARPRFDLGEIELRHTYVETRTAKFDLTLFAAEAGDGIETILEYRTDLFDRETVHRMLRHYGQLLDTIALEPDRRISEMAFLTEAEQRLLFAQWQGPTQALNERPLTVDQITARAAERPDLVAVVGAGRSMTYRQLEHAATAMARRLMQLGAAPGRPVAHFMDRTPESIAAILAILRSGAAYVPIDPSYPSERRRFVLRDAGIDLAVTASPLAEKIQGMVRQTVVADAVHPEATDATPLPQLEPHQTAYIIYTSGSTGRPKGVRISHRNLRSSTEARVHYYAEPPTRFLLVPSFAFDSSIAVIFWTLAAGGTLVLADSDDARDPERLGALIRDHRVSDLLCIPTLYRELLRLPDLDLRSLKRVIVAGESCPPSLVAAHYERLSGTTLVNEYGPTEVTVWATAHACSPTDRDAASVPIGRPVANGAAYVLDHKGQAVPVGIAGELFLGGDGVAEGYHNRDDLTAERFVTRLLPVVGQVRLYRSGDIGRWRADGVLEFLGRGDDQLKLRGYRLEPGEIEWILEEHPDVRRAAVVATARGAGRVPGERDELLEMAVEAPQSALGRLLAEIEHLSPEETDRALRSAGASESRAERMVERRLFRVELHTAAPGFVAAPRDAQRNWVLTRAMEEFADDLEHLDVVAPSFVRGFDHRLDRDLRDIAQAQLTAEQIMEDWQTPLMQAMARHVSESHGDVLEIGFGRGVSAELIQQFGVRSHTIIEANDHSIRQYFEPWRRRHAGRDIRLLHARWQDVADRLGPFDGIFFHAFPMNEHEFTEHVLRSVTFAEHAFGPMAAHLVEGGVFTYLTTEIDSLSRGHQRSLFTHFRTVSMHVERVTVPDDTHDTWWANSMMVVKAVK